MVPRRCPVNNNHRRSHQRKQNPKTFTLCNNETPPQIIASTSILFNMADASRDKQAALFRVYLRLRPPPGSNPAPTSSTGYPTLPGPERFLTVEPAEQSNEDIKTHITLNPPNDNRRRAVEKFAFTSVFEEGASQLDVFSGTGVLELVEGVLGNGGGEGRDGLLATLGVTGSGKVCSPQNY
jgi:hypothetical protein